MYDILFQNISVIDGTGAPAYVGDVAVKDGKIVLSPSGPAKETVDGTGLSLCPGFIDAHSHGDLTLGTEAGRLCKTSQGITTELTGQCGQTMVPASSVPARQEQLAKLVSLFTEKPDLTHCSTLQDYLQWAGQQELSCNFAIMVGHSTLRIAAMGFDQRKPDEGEMAHMKAMLREAMEQGAMGLSSGLIYAPGCYADESELIELCKVVAEYGGLYATHLRNEASKVVEAVEEAIRVAEAARCRLNISHHKVCGKDNWNTSVQTLALVHAARNRGMDITLDVYPYTASMTALNVCLPAHFFANGPEKMGQMLKDPTVRAELGREMQTMDGRWRHCGGAEGILIANAPATPEARGLTVAEYAKKTGKSELDAYFDIVAANGHSASGVFFSMSKEDLHRIVLDENTVLGTDGIVPDLTAPTHPRGMGSFPKAIRYFVREQGLLTLEEMIHKMTLLPAERYRLAGKGRIAQGYDADLVVFRAEEIADRADYRNGLALSAGIDRVLVGGTIVYEKGELTHAPAGKFIPCHTI